MNHISPPGHLSAIYLVIYMYIKVYHLNTLLCRCISLRDSRTKPEVLCRAPNTTQREGRKEKSQCPIVPVACPVLPRKKHPKHQCSTGRQLLTNSVQHLGHMPLPCKYVQSVYPVHPPSILLGTPINLHGHAII